MFEIHISPGLQIDLDIFGADKAVVSFDSIIQKSGFYSGLSIAIRRHLTSYSFRNIYLKLQRIQDGMHPDWFRVTEIVPAPKNSQNDQLQDGILSSAVPGRNPENDWIKYVKEENDQPGLIVKEVDKRIGKGVFAERKFHSGAFLLEYHGEMISEEEGNKRECSYPAEYGSFLLYFKSGRTVMCVDATFSSRIGRFVNDGIGDEKNAELRVVHIETKPHIVLFACRNICQGEEIRFDYGVKDLPWRPECMLNNLNKNKNKKQNHLTKECTVALRTLDLGAKEWYYEKEDGTSSYIKNTGYQLLPSSGQKEEENAGGHISSTIVKTRVSVDIETGNNRKAPLTLTEATDSKETIHKISHYTDEEIVAHTNELPDKNDEEVYAEEHTSNEGFSDINAVVKPGSTSVTPNAGHARKASLTLEEMAAASQEPKKEIPFCSDEEIIANASDLPYYFATKVVLSDLERSSFSEKGRGFSPSNEVEITDQGASTYTEVKEAHKERDSAKEEDTVHYYISVEEGHSSTPERAIEIKFEMAKGEEKSVDVVPLELERGQATENQSSEITKPAGRNKSKSKAKKPHRPCPFCYCLKSALSKHLVKKHGDQTEVKAAMNLPKQDRDRAFQLLKRKGIMLANMKTVSSGLSTSTDLFRERNKQAPQKSDLIYCSKCFGFFIKKYFSRHRKGCHLNEQSTYLPHPVKPEISVLNSKDDEKFTSEILGSFHDDEVGRLCKSDTEILSFGKKKFRKLLTKRNSEKYEDKKSSIRSEMRRIGHLYNQFRQTSLDNNMDCLSSLDMLKSENFYIFEEAVECVTTKDDGGIKNGLRKEIGYSIKRLCKFLYGKFSVEHKNEYRSQVEDFLNVLNYFWSDLFGEAESSLVLNRQTKLRKPLNLPKESEVKRLRQFTLMELQKLTASEYEFIASSDYIKLRNLVASRLTLFNARRGGEPCCLQISQWIEAENNIWLGESNSADFKDHVEQSLLNKFKIAYQVGKGQKLVPLLILDDCWGAIRKLIDPEIREQAGVHRDNCYVFPHTQYSLKHVGGWVAVTESCSHAGLDKTITATGMRHYVSTLYASLDMKESERQTFFNHMGHSETINKNVYQSPLARQTIVRVGKVLEQIDQGEVSLSSANVSDTRDTVTANCSHALSGEQDQISEVIYTRVGNRNNSTEGGLNVELNKKEVQNREECNSTCQQKSQNIERRYKLWSIEDTEVIKTYFNKYIFTIGNLQTNRGPLPGVEELKAFCAEFPNILNDLSKQEKIKRLRTKIFNERKLAREKLRRAAGKDEANKLLYEQSKNKNSN